MKNLLLGLILTFLGSDTQEHKTRDIIFYVRGLVDTTDEEVRSCILTLIDEGRVELTVDLGLRLILGEN